MSSQQLFGVAVRAIGLYWLTHGVSLFGFSFFPSEGYSTWTYILGAGVEMVVGVILMLKADGFVALCYTAYDEYGNAMRSPNE